MDKNSVIQQWSSLKKDFLGTWGHWQDRRFIWFFGAFIALGSELFSVYFFQNYLGVQACEMCVYIRFSMILIFIGGCIGGIAPQKTMNKILGYSLILWAILRGIIWSIKLEMINIEAANNSHFVSSCSLFDIKFPFSLPLSEWFPNHFFPIGLCGEDTWRLFGLNMAEYSLIMFTLFALFILLMLAGWCKKQRL